MSPASIITAAGKPLAFFVPRNIVAIAWKETKAYFTSPMAYIVGAVFAAYTGIIFVSSISRAFPEASIRDLVTPATFFFVILAPVLTMRLIAEEQKLGTLELLLTAPVRDYEVVIGKYLASLLILMSCLALTLYFVLLLYWYGDPDTGPVMSSYIGMLLYGAAALSVGLFTSTLSANQIVSAVVAIFILVFLGIIDLVANLVSGIGKEVLEQMSLTRHLQDFPRGVISTNDVIYYVSLIALFLFLAVRSLETRRWR